MACNIIFALLVGASLVGADIVKGKPTLKDYKAGKAKAAKDKAAGEANDAKMGAVNKVIEMLETLQKQTIEEGEEEGKSYLEFSRFCQTMIKKKTAAIGKEKTQKTKAETTIKSLVVDEAKLNKNIKANNEKIKALQKTMAINLQSSEEAFALYERNSADLISGVTGVSEAVKVLKAGKSSLLQIQSVTNTVNTALMLADTLGLNSGDSAGHVQAFLQMAQQPAVEMENYKSHSGGIVATMEKLQTAFQDQKDKLDMDESKRVGSYNLGKQRNTDLMTAETTDLENNRETLNKKKTNEGTQTEGLATTTGELDDDRQFLSELQAGCTAKKETFNQRSALRKRELDAINKATKIIKTTVAEKTGSATVRLAQIGTSLHIADAVASDEDSMDALEVEAETIEAAEPVAFLQKRQRVTKSHSSDDREMIASLLQNRGEELKSSTLLSLAARIEADPFAKIKGLVQDMIEKLLKEASAEANKKGECDKSFSDAKQKRDMAQEKSADANAEMASLEAALATLNKDILALAQDIADLKDANAEATATRKKESKENANTISEAKAGLAAVNKATEILSRFYKTAAKETVAGATAKAKAEAAAKAAKAKKKAKLLEEESDEDADPFGKAPDAGFGNDEAYTGAQGASGGIVGMMEVIASDFTRTIASTAADDKKEEDEHREFMTVSLSSLAEKKMAHDQKKKYRDEADDKLTDADDTLDKQTKILAGAIKELLATELYCHPPGQSAEDRFAKREEEIESLKTALKKLENDE